jgi:hypothetical protein
MKKSLNVNSSGFGIATTRNSMQFFILTKRHAVLSFLCSTTEKGLDRIEWRSTIGMS